MKPRISIIVCTFNRSELLVECLDSLEKQSIDADTHEVLIVDNNSSDSTAVTAMHFVQRNPHFKVITEPQQGLSYARNRGWREAKSEWVAYIDDDSKASVNYMERLLYVIDNYNFDCFGGVYLPWYKYGKPRWFKDEYATNGRQLDHIGILDKYHVCGGVIAFRKSALQSVGGFNTHLGMKGTTIAYGEETHVQEQLRKSGYLVGFDPELIVYHVVASYKLSPIWFLRSGYASGKASWLSLDKDVSAKTILQVFKVMIYDFIYTFLPSTKKLRQKEYYIQNWVIEVCKPQVKHLGALVGACQNIVRPGRRSCRIESGVRDTSTSNTFWTRRPMNSLIQKCEPILLKALSIMEALHLMFISPKNSRKFYVVSCERNAGVAAIKCLESIYSQSYNRAFISHIFIDDASTDNTPELISDWLEHHPDHNVTYIPNTKRMGILSNHMKGFRMASSGSIIVEVNGDDWLSDSGVIRYINKIYDDADVWMTYNTLTTSSGRRVKPWPIRAKVIQDNSFRENGCYGRALHSFRQELFTHVKEKSLIDPETGEYFISGNDKAFYFSLQELAGTHARHLYRTTYVYDFDGYAQDYGTTEEQEARTLRIRQIQKYEPLETLHTTE